MNINEQKIELLNNVINEKSIFTLIVHANPDGDTMGSATALYTILKNKGKEVKIVSPTDCPEYLQWLSGAENMVYFLKNQKETEALLNTTEVILCLDFNSTKRTEKLKPLLDESKAYKIMIDHHPSPEYFANLSFSQPEACATAELLYFILVQMGYELQINKEVATSLYTGIVTDTGCFSYGHLSPQTYRIVADLKEKGICIETIHSNIFNTYTANRLRLLGEILCNNLVIFEDIGVAYLYITLEQQKKYSFSQGDSEGFVNYPFSIKGIRLCALITEKEDIIKTSFRSKGDISVNDFSKKYFNGGGHTNAAGGRINGKLTDILKYFEKCVYEFLS
ncbi:MAG: bifunctional oligoribonuclease/PAP phosphatase NrnA [Bacteroidales bacterium]